MRSCSKGAQVHFDADDLVGLVGFEDDAGRDLFGFDDGGVVKAQVEGVGYAASLS